MPGRPNILPTTSRPSATRNSSSTRTDKQQVPEAELLSTNKLSLSKTGLTSIPLLASVVVEVDLSGNFIVRLVLTSNQLTKLEGFVNVPALQHLLLQDNCFCTYADLSLDMLAALPQLQTVYLQNSDGSQPNPVCSRPGYKSTILNSLVTIRNLDGERSPQFEETPPAATVTEKALPTITKHSDTDISRLLPKAWGQWLPLDTVNADSKTQEASGIETDTKNLLDDCVVLSGVLQDEINKATVLLK